MKKIIDVITLLDEKTKKAQALYEEIAELQNVIQKFREKKWSWMLNYIKNKNNL